MNAAHPRLPILGWSRDEHFVLNGPATNGHTWCKTARHVRTTDIRIHTRHGTLLAAGHRARSIQREK